MAVWAREDVSRSTVSGPEQRRVAQAVELMLGCTECLEGCHVFDGLWQMNPEEIRGLLRGF